MSQRNLSYIFASWRRGYVEANTNAKSNEVCAMCAISNSTDFDKDLVVFKGLNASVCLNLYPYTTGHLLILGKSHVGSPDEIPAEEIDEIFKLTLKSIKVLRTAYNPDGINFGSNIGTSAGAGIPEHFHIHALPRWIGDTNFMTSIADTRVLPEDLQFTLAKVRKTWQDMF